MRLPNNAFRRFLALVGLTAALGACAIIPGGGNRIASAESTPVAASTGPQADFPMVLGDPFTVDGVEYTPANTASYDEVGYATVDRDGGQGITVAHKTLPMPSYVEVTSLETGRTILARVERRGPMTSTRLVGLSIAAQAQLGSGEGTAVRVRRVNPPEAERAELRAGRAVKERMETPKSLLAVLQRKLPEKGSVSLASATAPNAATAATPVSPPKPMADAELPPVIAKSDVEASFDRAFDRERKANTRYPLRPIDSTPVAVSVAREPMQVRSPNISRPAAVAEQQESAEQVRPATGDYVIQAAAFASKANADRAAGKIGGFVIPSGRFYRVRTGPYATRGQAEAALAKVRAAGYSDARVFTAG